MVADNTAQKQRGVPFQAGESGNPVGRPKGSRNKLGEAFLNDMLADWSTNGAATIAKVREEDPTQYVKVVASVLPKELNVRVNDFDDLTDDQLARQLASIASQLAGAGFALGEGVGPATEAQPAAGVSTLQ